MRRIVMSIVLALVVFVAAFGQHGKTQAATNPPHWTLCKLHYQDPAHFLWKRCFHHPMPKYAGQRPTGHWWREVYRSDTLSKRITYPTFAPPPVDMSRAAAPCAWGWRSYIAASSAKYGVPTRVIAAVICVESSGEQYANSCTSGTDIFCSQGLMQLIPSTCATVVYGSAAPYYVGLCEQYLYTPAFNIDAGTHYLLNQYRAFGYSWFNAAGAYNCGSCISAKYVAAFSHFYYG